MRIGAKQMNKRNKRDKKGRFIKGCKPGPGRPRKKALKVNDVPLWSYKLLHQAWLAFKTANAYSQLEILKCSKCGNEDASLFDYKLDQKGAKLRCRCQKCGKWVDIREQRPWWYYKPLPVPLTKKDREMLANQRGAR
jgi:DNA-directed RNA polymerase subunit M/transcription elongation factor TFIIS